MTADDLDVLERRVGEKWAAAAAVRMPELPELDVDLRAWFGTLAESGQSDPADRRELLRPYPAEMPQFPREQWASYPNRRRVALMICDRLLDFDELSDEQWVTLCMVMQYGGKTRIA